MNFITDVPGAISDVLRIADSEIDVADFHSAHGQNSEVIIRHKSPRSIARHHFYKRERHITKRQSDRRRQKRFVAHFDMMPKVSRG